MWGFPKREERGSVARASAALRVSRARALTGADVRKRNSAYPKHAASRRQTCSRQEFTVPYLTQRIKRAAGPTDLRFSRARPYRARLRDATRRAKRAAE